MKKTLLSLTLLSAFAVGSVQAAPTVAASGTLNFFGNIITDSCTVTSPGNTGFLKNFVIEMGTVSALSLGTEANPGSAPNGSGAISKSLDMQIECGAGTKVALQLTPNRVSGKGIGLSTREGGAQNVQIMLVSNQTTLDFTSGSASLESPNNSGSVTIPLNAYYTLTNGKTAKDVVAGKADATVAYELSYE